MLGIDLCQYGFLFFPSFSFAYRQSLRILLVPLLPTVVANPGDLQPSNFLSICWPHHMIQWLLHWIGFWERQWYARAELLLPTVSIPTGTLVGRRKDIAAFIKKEWFRWRDQVVFGIQRFVLGKKGMRGSYWDGFPSRCPPQNCWVSIPNFGTNVTSHGIEPRLCFQLLNVGHTFL